MVFEQRLEVSEGVSWEDIWGRKYQAAGTASAKALRLECAFCVWSEGIVAGGRKGVRGEHKEMRVGR